MICLAHANPCSMFHISLNCTEIVVFLDFMLLLLFFLKKCNGSIWSGQRMCMEVTQVTVSGILWLSSARAHAKVEGIQKTNHALP